MMFKRILLAPTKALGRLFRGLFVRFCRYAKKHWAGLFAAVFIWILPILALNYYVALIQTVAAGIKVTWLGAVVAAVLFIALRKRIWAMIYRLKNGAGRAMLMNAYLVITWLLLFAVLYFINSFIGKLYQWWLICGISFVIGAVFRVIDQLLTREVITNGQK